MEKLLSNKILIWIISVVLFVISIIMIPKIDAIGIVILVIFLPLSVIINPYLNNLFEKKKLTENALIFKALKIFKTISLILFSFVIIIIILVSGMYIRSWISHNDNGVYLSADVKEITEAYEKKVDLYDAIEDALDVDLFDQGEVEYNIEYTLDIPYEYEGELSIFYNYTLTEEEKKSGEGKDDVLTVKIKTIKINPVQPSQDNTSKSRKLQDSFKYKVSLPYGKPRRYHFFMSVSRKDSTESQDAGYSSDNYDHLYLSKEKYAVVKKTIEAEEAKLRADAEESGITKDSPHRILLNTQTVETNLTSLQIENNYKYYDGKIIKNWKLGVSDVSRDKITTFIPGLGYADGGSHGWFKINKYKVKDWGSYSHNLSDLKIRQTLSIKSAKLEKEFSGFSLVDVEFN